MKSVPECKHLRFYVPNWETILVVHAVAMRWRLSRVGPQCERAEGREESASRGRSPIPQFTSLRVSVDISPLSWTEPNRTGGWDSVPARTFSGVLLGGKLRTKNDTQAGLDYKWLERKSPVWRENLLGSARSFSPTEILSVSTKKGDAVREKGGKSGAESRLKQHPDLQGMG